MAKKFKKFILEASVDSCRTVTQGTNSLMDGFYCIVSDKKYKDDDLKTYLNDEGYDVTPKELQKIRNLHDGTELLFQVHNRDY